MKTTLPNLLVWRDVADAKGNHARINGEAAALFHQRHGIPVEVFAEMTNLRKKLY
jgi:SH3-like domain-containing protein